jgi:signal transduction histidine kinase
MFSISRPTAARRISIWTTLAFAIGTAVAFSIVYLLVAREIKDRSDAWLIGESETLTQVAVRTTGDRLYNRIVREVAEVATREVPDDRNAQGQRLNSVFFLEENTKTNESPLWVGPGAIEPFLKVIRATKFAQGVPQSLRVDGWPTPFRVVVRQENDRTVYLGLSTRGTDHLLHALSRRFLLLLGGTVLIGFLISFASARGTLLRVERIAETVGRIDHHDLGERLPESANSDEISRLAQTFNRMLDRIQSSVTELRMVTDAVAHDLKSPLTSIRGTLESSLSSESNERMRESIGDAIEGLDKLLSLLNTTLDVAEAQGGALLLNRATVDFSAVVRQLSDLYLPAMVEQQHELTLDVEPDVMVDADMSLLHRAVNNLFENELTHLPTGCHVGIQLYRDQLSAELVIEDNGPGIPPEVGNRAFERFVKGKHSPGHGLGLAFVDAVARAHGGSVKISNRPAGGAVVTFSMPAVVIRAESLTVAGG